MSDLDDLRRLRGGSEDPDAERVASMRAALLDEIQSENAHSGREPHPREGGMSSWVPRHRLAFGLSGAAAIAAVFALLAFVISGGSAPEAVAGTLERLARIAGQQSPAPAPGPGQYLYNKTKGVESQSSFDWTVLLPESRESWISPDGSGRILTVRGEPIFPSDRDLRAFRAQGSPGVKVGTTVDERFAPGELHYRDLSNLPTDPDRLGRLIKERKIENAVAGAAGSFAIVGALLHETYTRPAVREALFKVAAEIPGVRSLGKVNDPIGRRGVGVALTAHGTRHELIFDPRTSELLASLDQVRDPRVPGERGEPGTVSTYTTYFDSGVVDSVNSRP